MQRLPAKVLREGIPYKPDLLLYQVAGEEIILKDYCRKSLLVRNILGVLASSTEARALRVLEGIQGVPQFRGMPDRCSVAMTYLPCEGMPQRSQSIAENERFIRRLEDIVAEMHRRGVVHLDLRHRTNISRSPEGSPVVLDFATAIPLRRNWFGGSIAFELLKKVDLLALQNWTRRLCPHMLCRHELRRAGAVRRLCGEGLLGQIAAFLLMCFTKPDRKIAERRRPQ